MTIGWKDVLAIGAILFTVILTVSMLLGIQIPLINNWGTATIVMTIIGLLVFAFIGIDFISESMNTAVIATSLGFLAIFLAVIALVLNSEIIYLILVALLISTWIAVLIGDNRTRRLYTVKKHHV